MCNNVDLPVPFFATNATFCPSSIPKERSVNKLFTPTGATNNDALYYCATPTG
jgi:hypothetical protein